MNTREGRRRAIAGRLGMLGEPESMHVQHVTSQVKLECSPFRLSFQPFRLSQTVGGKLFTALYDIQPLLATTTPEQFANQLGIITNPHPFVSSFFLLNTATDL